jgi:hypothetical protein|tara:strand:- start:695 stop:862 length:168 start_codon:yes stop_codon:yes gene_type:complete
MIEESTMKLELDFYDKEVLVDCIEYRLQNDLELITNDSLREEIEDLLTIIEDELV